MAFCSHPSCTGVHGHSKPYADWCPSIKRKVRRSSSHRVARTFRLPALAVKYLDISSEFTGVSRTQLLSDAILHELAPTIENYVASLAWPCRD